ncbi:hypothetical protein Q0V21_08250 [Paenibacillus sp. 11B]|uniref:hypothetical protein n=1 Tax=Paenibacillus sp. 11B TaxID=3060965 RepID=UPI00264CCDEC|nr:hypothetical protein [Paenibacillus sp. 11B]MDN8588760.1 hypothetical protein [Paenibacillus sp. 11B]
MEFMELAMRYFLIGSMLAGGLLILAGLVYATMWVAGEVWALSLTYRGIRKSYLDYMDFRRTILLSMAKEADREKADKGNGERE